MSYDQSSNYDKLNSRLNRYVQSVIGIWDSLSLEASKVALSTGHIGDEPFKFSDYPITASRVDDLRKTYVEDLRGIVYAGTSAEWKQSNIAQDLLVDNVLSSYFHKQKGKKGYNKYYEVNSKALETFQQRKTNGLNLSKNLWNQSADMVEEIEGVLSVAIQKGIDAVTLSKQVSKYLLDFGTFQKDYTEKFGHASNVKDCEYRSIRLARSEINMAYREAERQRWQQFDFVKGIRISISRNGEDRRAANPHIEDICDELAGDYPKDFKWLGWHPNCRCFATPILMTEEEFFNHERGDEVEGVIEDVPKGFKDWVKENEDRIHSAERSNTLPSFLQDNGDVYKRCLNFDYANYDKNVEKLKNDDEYEHLMNVRKEARYLGVDMRDVENHLLNGDVGSADYQSLLDDVEEKIIEKAAYASELRRKIVKLVNHVETAQNTFPYLELYPNKDVDFFVRTHRMTTKDIRSHSGRFPFDHAEKLAELTDERIDRFDSFLRKRCDQELASRLGIDYKLKPMSFEKADELRGNENFLTDISAFDEKMLVTFDGKKSHPYHVNCTACCVTNEARRRGLNVEACGNFEGSRVEELSKTWYRAYIDPKTMKVAPPRTYRFNEEHSVKMMYEELREQMKEPGRYVVRWSWQGKNSGHVSSFETTPNGVFKSIDAQSGKHDIDDVLYNKLVHIERPSPSVQILRVDDKILNPHFCDEIVKMKN